MINLSKFSKSQLLVLVSFAIAEFFNAICFSLQAPFFPQEAELKGATATEYGCVFGVFELVVFLISPWYGKYLNVIGPKKLFFFGIITSAVCSILFGLLDLINGHILFISSAFVIRIIEALGNAAFLTAGFAVIANEFPYNIASTFASLETFFGLGLIAGPTLGGVLYELGGFELPFITVGVFLIICAIFTRVLIPSSDTYQTASRTSGKLWHLLKIKGIPVCTGTIITTTISIGFISATLEPHIRQFNLSAIGVGFVFVVNGATYGASAPAWGLLCDRNYVRPKAISVLGGFVLLIGISFLGPAPYMPIKESLTFVIFGLFLHGLGIGARLVPTFTDALQVAIVAGMPNSIETYGLISGLWTSSVALGSFIGPTVSGFLYDNCGFANASLFVIILICIMLIFEIWSLFESPKIQIQMKNHENLDSNVNVEGNNSNHVSTDNSTKLTEKRNIHIGSNRVLNLLYNSKTDLSEENSPLLVATTA